MKARSKRPKYEAVTFYGPDPASSPFGRIFTDSLKEATEHMKFGTFGTVVETESGKTVADHPPVARCVHGNIGNHWTESFMCYGPTREAILAARAGGAK